MLCSMVTSSSRSSDTSGALTVQDVLRSASDAQAAAQQRGNRSFGHWLDDVADVRSRLLKVSRHLATKTPAEAAYLLHSWQQFLQVEHLRTITAGLGVLAHATIVIAWDAGTEQFGPLPTWLTQPHAGRHAVTVRSATETVAVRKAQQSGRAGAVPPGTWVDCCA